MGWPYDAEEALQETFGADISSELIKELVSDLNDISLERSGRPDNADFDDDYLTQLISSGTDPFVTLLSSLSDIEDAVKIKVGENERKTLHKLLFANPGDLFLKTLGKSDKYLEVFVFKTPHFQNTQIKLSSIFERFRRIEAEVRTAP